MGTVKDGEKSKEILDEMELKILLDATGRLPVYLSGWYDALKETMQHSLKGEKLSFEIAVKALQSQPAVEKMFEDLNAMFEKASEKAELTKLVDGIGNFNPQKKCFVHLKEKKTSSLPSTPTSNSILSLNRLFCWPQFELVNH